MNKQTDIKIAVLGLGHVGLPTALGFADLGWSVVGVDKDRVKSEKILSGEVPFYEVGVDELLRKHLDSGRFSIEPEVSKATEEADVLFVCVDTPQREDGAADLSMVESVARDIAPHINGYKLIVEKSTSPVQTARRIKQSIQRYSGDRNLTTGSNGEEPAFDVAVNPEFLREGLAVYDFFNPDRIVLGVESDRATSLLTTIYQPLLNRMDTTFEERVIVTDINTAEVIKHTSNAFLATKLSFINMVAELCEATGADIGDVSRGIGMDHRIGSSYLRAGVGYGGSCLPKDIRAFNWIATQNQVDFGLLDEVERINGAMIDRFIAKLYKTLWVLKGKTLAVWGLSFKPGTDDVRDAPSLSIVRELVDEGAKLKLYDPQAMDEFRRVFDGYPQNVTYCESALEATDGAEALLILTEWKEFLDIDVDEVRDNMLVPVIVDGRNLMDPNEVRSKGFEYYSIGRP